MPRREYSYTWEWDLRASPEQLWPLVADTNRFDRDAGVPPAAELAEGAGLTNGRTRVRVKQYGVPLDYVQEPFEWVQPSRFSVQRTFTSGPLGSLRIAADLEPLPDGGTHLRYQVGATPRRAIFGPAIPIQVGRILARKFDRTFRQYDRIAALGDLSIPTGPSPRLARGAVERLTRQRAQLESDGVEPSLADRLIDLVRTADDLTAARLRPYVFADQWGLPRRPVLEAFLLATRSGLVELNWDVICPMCRGAKGSSRQLRTLPGQVHCDTCLVDYDANFANSVELTFAPVASIRTVNRSQYCIGNPMQTPHVVRQQVVEAGTTARIDVPSEPGRYRLRCLGHPGSTYVRVEPEGLPEASVAISTDRDAVGEVLLRPGAHLEVIADDGERLLLLERTAMGDLAVTAAEVTAMQRFRDLFADEVLRPSEQVSVGTMTVVFTDLCDSTQLYQDIGDAVAFGRVLDHFDILTAAIAEEGGGVVKTIGDAVMAVFPRPAPALRAMLQAQTRVAHHTREFDRPLALKIGIHAGPCIAVNLNDRLDYFGSTVNLAARLQGHAQAEEIVLSAEAFADREVQDCLAVTRPRPAIRRDVASLKGFDAPVPILRLSLASTDARTDPPAEPDPDQAAEPLTHRS